MSEQEAVMEAPAGQLRFRTAELVDVSYPQRTIEMVVIPYESEALVPHPHNDGRMVKEIISRGAFDGIERRANRIRVNRDHKLERTIGRALTLHPSREEGLVANVRIARTALGDETLALADEGVLDASAAYLPMPGGERWETKQRFRVSKAWLGHIALTPDPAHVTARVLAVRQAPQPIAAETSSTPNLDRLRLMILADESAVLDTRYSHG